MGANRLSHCYLNEIGCVAMGKLLRLKGFQWEKHGRYLPRLMILSSSGRLVWAMLARPQEESHILACIY